MIMPDHNSLFNLSITNSSKLLNGMGTVFKEHFRFNKSLKVSGLLSCSIDEKEEHVLKVNLDLKPSIISTDDEVLPQKSNSSTNVNQSSKEANKTSNSCTVDDPSVNSKNLSNGSIDFQLETVDDTQSHKVHERNDEENSLESERKDRRKSRKPKRKLISTEKKTEDCSSENVLSPSSSSKKVKLDETVETIPNNPDTIVTQNPSVTESEVKSKNELNVPTTSCNYSQSSPSVQSSHTVRNIVVNANLASILAAAQNQAPTSTVQTQIQTPPVQATAYTNATNSVAITGPNGEIIGTIPQHLLASYLQSQNTANQLNQNGVTQLTHNNMNSTNNTSLTFLPNNTFNILRQAINTPTMATSAPNVSQQGINLSAANNILHNTNGTNSFNQQAQSQTHSQHPTQTVALIGTLGSLPCSSTISNQSFSSPTQSTITNLSNNDTNPSVAALLKSITDLKGLSTCQNSNQKIAVVADGNTIQQQNGVQGINLNLTPQHQLQTPVSQAPQQLNQYQQPSSLSVSTATANIDLKALAAAIAQQNQQRSTVQTQQQNQIPAGSIVLSYTRQGNSDLNFMLQPAATSSSNTSTPQITPQPQTRVSLQQLNVSPSQYVCSATPLTNVSPAIQTTCSISHPTNNDTPLSLVTSANTPISNQNLIKKETSPSLVINSPSIVPSVKPLKPDFRKYKLRDDPNDAEIDKILENIKGQMMQNAELKRQKPQLILPSSSKPTKLPLQPVQQSHISDVNSATVKKYVSRSSSADSSGHGSHRDAVDGEGANLKAYRCHYCLKTFNRKFCRERHERLHTGVKPYTCDVCDEKFIRLEDKKRHVRGYAHYTSATALAATRNAERSEASKREEESQILRILAKETGKVIDEAESSTSEVSDLIISDGQTTLGDENSPEDLDIENNVLEQKKGLKMGDVQNSSQVYHHRRRSSLKHSVQPVRIVDVENHQLNVKT